MTLDLTCTICADPMLPHRRFRGASTCGRWRCERILRDRQLDADRAGVAVTTALDGVSGAAWVELPANEQPIVALPDERRRTFEGFLRALVADAWGTNPAPGRARAAPDPDPDTEPPCTILASGCATCRGHCCGMGQDHAHLDADGIARQRVLDPGLTPEQAVAAYLALLPARAYQGSCVFHTRTGCALPRTMRSDLCNTYECSGLLELRQRNGADEGTRSLLLAKQGLRLVRARVLDERGDTVAELAPGPGAERSRRAPRRVTSGPPGARRD